MIARVSALLAAMGLVAFVVYGFIAYGAADLGTCMAEGSGRRARLLQRYACSPHLLAGGPREWFAFAWLWSFPATAAAFSFLAWRRQRRLARPVSSYQSE